MNPQPVLDYVEANRQRYLDELQEFVAIPSISAQPDHRPDVRAAAEWTAHRLRRAGAEAEIIESAGHPAVFAQARADGDAKVTILVYGHYDVQPEGDPERWHSRPFVPEVRDGALYARGAADDKGQMLTHVLATEAWLAAGGGLPVNVKFLLEGEEEVSSPNLPDIIRQHRQRLACDYVVLSDTCKFSDDQPAITYGTRGMVYKEVILRGPKEDLHSGSFGGTVANPANVLASLAAALHDDRGRVLIDGFYDDVAPVADDERRAWEELGFDEENYRRQLGAPQLTGEADCSTLERRWARPTCDINGIYGGYAGQGANTIVPARAGMKISTRLVPNQDPQKISDAFDRTIRRLLPPTVEAEILNHGAPCAAYMTPLDCPGMQAARDAVADGFGKAPVLIREGGTLPILPMFKAILGAESLLLGYSLPNCNAHGPNEFLVLDDFHAGIRTNVHLLRRLAARA